MLPWIRYEKLSLKANVQKLTQVKINSMSTGDSEGPAWNKFWMSFDNETESMMSGEGGSRHPQTLDGRSLMSPELSRPGVDRLDSVMPTDSASHTGHDSPEPSAVTGAAASPHEDAPFPFKFKAPSGRVHRVQVAPAAGMEELVSIVAEKLGSERYFLFIRDFIFYVSAALLEHSGSIYQYVGDEVVTSWPATASGARRSLRALVDARRTLGRKRNYFLRKYGVFPEFRVGIHEGDVTIGEIGIVKKDLAMSGDTMNTAARIRTACSELEKMVLGSQSFVALLPGRDNILSASVGMLDLKGKSNSLELFTEPSANGQAAPVKAGTSKKRSAFR